MKRLVVALGVGGCAGAGEGVAEGVPALEDYVSLDAGRTWTWRDDGGGEEPPAEGALVRGEAMGDGSVVLRRGSAGEGEEVGLLRFSVEADGIGLPEWRVGERAGSGPERLADSEPGAGDRHHLGGWLCVTETGGAVEAYYATWEDALAIDCSTDDGSATLFLAFGRGAGPVRLEADGAVLLDLVRPW